MYHLIIDNHTVCCKISQSHNLQQHPTAEPAPRTAPQLKAHSPRTRKNYPVLPSVPTLERDGRDELLEGPHGFKSRRGRQRDTPHLQSKTTRTTNSTRAVSDEPLHDHSKSIAMALSPPVAKSPAKKETFFHPTSARLGGKRKLYLLNAKQYPKSTSWNDLHLCYLQGDQKQIHIPKYLSGGRGVVRLKLRVEI